MVTTRTYLVLCLGDNKPLHSKIKQKAVCYYMLYIIPQCHNTWHSWPYYAHQCIILNLNILNNILEKIIKIWYFENTHRDESIDISYDIIYLYILVEKYHQTNLNQNCTFSNGSSIDGRKEYIIWLNKNKNGYMMKLLGPTNVLDDQQQNKNNKPGDNI